MADGKPGRGSDQFPLRLPDGMREQLKASADKNGRSMNAEIVALLDDAVMLQAQVEALTLERDMTERDRGRLAKDLRDLRQLREEMGASEDAARQYFLKKYEGAFRMIANMYAASTYNRNHRGQLHDLLADAGIATESPELRMALDPAPELEEDMEEEMGMDMDQGMSR